ncbi:MAG TPA: hypothetical protein VJ761_12940 [Ktedonobacteraceae bacterium]|nr:hypothetical protein [Ktedonobacteraceae bacterium]
MQENRHQPTILPKNDAPRHVQQPALDCANPRESLPASFETVAILHELDLGQHILLILSDSSIDLLAHTGQTPSLVDHGLRLDSDETYRLFISLREQFQRKSVLMVERDA